jgi:hypothetical protein
MTPTSIATTRKATKRTTLWIMGKLIWKQNLLAVSRKSKRKTMKEIATKHRKRK